jgi:predicted nucleic acid-binding protein
VDRLFLDANVLFTAAHNPDGKASFLFDALDRNHWTLFMSAYPIEEARRNIVTKYPECERRLGELPERISIVSQPASGDIPIVLPEQDRPIFLAALAAGVTHLLTGDIKDFGPYMNQPNKSNGIVIQTVADYLSELR